MRPHLITWISLVALSVVSYFSSESLAIASTITLIVITIIKCVLVGFQFMKLHQAHVLWKIAFLALIGLFALFVGTMTAQQRASLALQDGALLEELPLHAPPASIANKPD